jgi:hypothetical protein
MSPARLRGALGSRFGGPAFLMVSNSIRYGRTSAIFMGTVPQMVNIEQFLFWLGLNMEARRLPI